MSHETAEVLRAARAKIEKPEQWAHGWRELGAHWSWRKFRRIHRHCALTAIPLHVSGNAYLSLAYALPDEWRDLPLPVFNDAPETTHADILALFDRAIAAEESRG